LSVEGHDPSLVGGRVAGVPVLILAGRAHYYEGHSMDAVTFPIRVLAQLGISDLLFTNASGGIHPRFRPGDLVCLSDHINLMGANPLRGVQSPSAVRFVDMTAAYSPALTALLKSSARHTGVRLRSGVYLAVSGPSFETPAEIRAFGRMGADLVGMSTVPEVLVARTLGLAVAGLSCVTNRAAGHGVRPLSHDHVLTCLKSSEVPIRELVNRFVFLYGQRRFPTADQDSD
jgi:purine-nucleoside phosphorylase